MKNFHELHWVIAHAFESTTFRAGVEIFIGLTLRVSPVRLVVVNAILVIPGVAIVAVYRINLSLSFHLFLVIKNRFFFFIDSTQAV